MLFFFTITMSSCYLYKRLLATRCLAKSLVSLQLVLFGVNIFPCDLASVGFQFQQFAQWFEQFVVFSL